PYVVGSFTSRSFSIFAVRVSRGRIGRPAASQLQIFSGRWGNCGSRRRSLEAIFVAHTRRRNTHVVSSALLRSSITPKFRCPLPNKFAQSISELCTNPGPNEGELYSCRLDFNAPFYLDGRVPADDQVTSLSGASGRAQDGRVAFRTTHWSVVLEAQGESPAAQEALEKLCRI